MPGHVNFSILDSSGETSRVGFHLNDINAANYEGTTGDLPGQFVGELRLAMNPLILGNHLKRTVVSDVYTDPATLPAPGAMREIKARFTYRDTVNARLGSFEVPTFDSASYASQGTDVIDLTQADLAAFVSAVESSTVSRDGNGIQIVSAEVVGRNI